jgi:signal peptidase I
MIHWFSPGWLKKADRFSKGVKKFIAYQRDLMPEDKLAEVQAAKAEYDTAMKAKNRTALEGDEGLEKKLLRMCEKAIPNYNSSPLKENVEVIIVAIIVALGIRAYYLQPFKIPTSSMQPTLNGIIGHRMAADEETPNLVKQAWEFAWAGRNYTEARVPEEWGEVELLSYQQQSKANFFTFTTLNFSGNKNLTMYAPAKHLLGDLCHIPAISAAAGPLGPDDNPREVEFSRKSGTGQPLSPRIILKGGTLIAKGWIESGDQLLVDKVSYHFTRPERDDVFVFSTKDIPGMGKPQHYIKRLTALPGDRLRIEPPLLYINGEPAKEFGMARVMDRKEVGYREEDGKHQVPLSPKGYGLPGAGDQHFLRATITGGSEEVQLGDKQYMAMGDNSYASSDSRYWGPVPEKNLVGPALFVYWPFKQHFGIIR